MEGKHAAMDCGSMLPPDATTRQHWLSLWDRD